MTTMAKCMECGYQWDTADRDVTPASGWVNDSYPLRCPNCGTAGSFIGSGTP